MKQILLLAAALPGKLAPCTCPGETRICGAVGRDRKVLTQRNERKTGVRPVKSIHPSSLDRRPR